MDWRRPEPLLVRYSAPDLERTALQPLAALPTPRGQLARLHQQTTRVSNQARLEFPWQTAHLKQPHLMRPEVPALKATHLPVDFQVQLEEVRRRRAEPWPASRWQLCLGRALEYQQAACSSRSVRNLTLPNQLPPQSQHSRKRATPSRFRQVLCAAPTARTAVGQEKADLGSIRSPWSPVNLIQEREFRRTICRRPTAPRWGRQAVRVMADWQTSPRSGLGGLFGPRLLRKLRTIWWHHRSRHEGQTTSQTISWIAFLCETSSSAFSLANRGCGWK